MIKFIESNASNIIAVVAILFTAYQAYLYRIHNVLSVKPHLNIFEIDGYENETAFLAVQLQNNGLGPAFITSFNVYLDGKIFDDFDEALKIVLQGILCTYSKSYLAKDYAVPAQKTVDIVNVRLSLGQKPSTEIYQALARLDIEIAYSCGYKKKYKPVTTKHIG